MECSPKVPEMSESPEWRGTREDVRSVGNRVAEVGLKYFCPDYVSKNGVSVTERNIRGIAPHAPSVLILPGIVFVLRASLTLSHRVYKFPVSCMFLHSEYRT